MLKRKALFMIITALILSYNVKAATAQEKPAISVDEAVIIALGNNQDYKIASHRLEEADEKVNAVWGQLLPALESEASILRQGADTGPMSLSDGQYDLKFIQLRFGINPGAFYHSLKQSHAGYALAKEELRRIRHEVEFNVIKGYFDAILAGEMVTLRSNSLQVLRENLKDVRRMYQTGSVPRFELLQAQVQLQNQEPVLREAENNYRTALEIFNYHLGFNAITYTVKIDDVDKSTIRLPAEESVIPGLINAAMKNRPEVLQVSLQKDALNHSRKVHQSSYLWPTFSVSGYYGKTYQLPNPVNINLGGGPSPDLSQITGSKDWQDTWQVRFAATYRWGTLIPFDSQRALEREEREKIQETEQKLLQIQRLTGITIRTSFGRLSTSYETILSQEKNLETAEEGLRIARESYRAGVIKNADLLNAELALTSARTGYVKALYDYYMSRAELNREIGVNSDTVLFREDSK